MALRPLLARLQEDSNGAALIRDGGAAFVSQSMRPYVVAALADGAAADRPTLVVAGDDRQAAVEQRGDQVRSQRGADERVPALLGEVGDLLVGGGVFEQGTEHGDLPI